MKLRSKQIAVIVSFLLFLAFWIFVFFAVGKPMIRFVSDPEKFRIWIDSHGFFGKIAFIGMIVFQMLIAIIPGEPLEIGAGYAFGFLEGTVLCTIGNFIGAFLVFFLVRTFGVKLIEVFFSREKILSLKFLQNTKRVHWIVFLLYFLPGTPKDLLSYFVGLTDMKWSLWLLIATFGRLPSVITSTAGGNALGERKYLFALIVFGITLLISLIGWFVYHIYTKRKTQRERENQHA